MNGHLTLAYFLGLVTGILVVFVAAYVASRRRP